MHLTHLFSGKTAVDAGTAGKITGQNTWNNYGVRDPSILTTIEGGTNLDDSGNTTLFFNARSRPVSEGGRTCVGMATGSPQTGWAVHPTPVFADGAYAAQGSALRISCNFFHLYYSPGWNC